MGKQQLRRKREKRSPAPKITRSDVLRARYVPLGQTADTGVNSGCVETAQNTILATCEEAGIDHDEFDSWEALVLMLADKEIEIEWAEGAWVKCEPDDGEWCGTIIKKLNEREFLVKENGADKEWRVNRNSIFFDDIPF